MAVVLVICLAGALFALSRFYSAESQRPELERRLTEAFGRPAHVGSLRLTLKPYLAVEATNVVVERDPAFGEGSLLQIDTASATISLWQYIRRNASAIGALELDRPQITLVKREDGVWNWATLGGRSPSVAAPAIAASLFAAQVKPATDPTVPSTIRVTNAVIVLVDRTASPAKETTYRNLNLQTSANHVADGYDLAGTVSGDSGQAGGEPLATILNFEIHLVRPQETPFWQGKGRVLSGSLATRNLAVDSISTDVALDEREMLHFDNVTVALYSGRLTGKVDVDLATPSNLFEANGDIQGIRLGDALKPRTDLAGALKGGVSGTLHMRGELGDFNSTLASLSGDAHATIDGAELASVNLLGEICKQGGFQNVVFEESTTKAERIEADLNVEKGRFGFKNLVVSKINGYADLHGDSGWVDVGNPAQIHLEGSATLLPALLDKLREANPTAAIMIQFLSSRPAVGIPLTLDGPISKPSVSVRWAAVAGLPF